jgi:hypothetical protein
MTAHEQYEAQLARDLKHHQERLVWLRKTPLQWSDGEPIEPRLHARLLRQSEEAIANPSSAYNTGPKEDEV